MRRNPRIDPDDGERRGGSGIVRVLADTPAAALEEELRRFEQERLHDGDHPESDQLALTRVRELVERRRRREQELSILYSTARLTALRGVDEVLENISRSAHQLVDSDITYLTVLEEDGTRFRVRAQTGAISPYFQNNFHASAEVGLAGLVAQTWTPLFIPNYLQSTEIVHHGDVDRPIKAEGIVSMLGVPLIAGDQFLGTLNVASREERVFAQEDIDLISAFANHAAVALRNSRLYDESRRALRDLQEAYATIESAVAIHEALTRMVLAGGGVKDVADLLVATFGGSVVAVDRTNEVIAACGLHPDDDELYGLHEHFALADAPYLAIEIGKAVEDSQRSGRCAVVQGDGFVYRHVVTIATASSYMGALVLSRDRRLEPVDVRTLEHASQIAALLILAQDAVVNAMERVRGELLTELMTAERPYTVELELRARARQVDPNNLNVLLVVDSTGKRHSDVVRELNNLAKSDGGLAGEHLGVPTALLVADDAGIVAERIHSHLRKTLRIPLLACTAFTGSSDPLASTFTMATRCCALMRELNVTDGHVTTADLAIYNILFDPGKSGTLTTFLNRSLGPLIEHDRDRGTDLVATLSTYFANSSNVAKTARALHVHTNTMTKRMERISTLLGYDFQQPDLALNLQLAVRLHKLGPRVGALQE